MTTPASQFLLQMAGWMGSGKSTIAREVGKASGAIVVDHDTTKTAIIRAGVSHPPAGAASYEVVFGLAADLLAQGHSVIIDSPSIYVENPTRGLAIAANAGVGYFFVECNCPEETANVRVADRAYRPSQVADAAHAATVRRSSTRLPHRPAVGVLVVDTTESVVDCVDAVLYYLNSAGASGPVIAVAE